MPLAIGDELLDFRHRRDVAAGTDPGAIERGGGAGELELTRQRPALQ